MIQNKKKTETTLTIKLNITKWIFKFEVKRAVLAV